MLDQLDREILEVATRVTPGAIITSPRQMMSFLHDAGRDVERMHKLNRCADCPSGWDYNGLPLWRSWEISGPAVVSVDVLKLLRRARRYTHLGASDQQVEARGSTAAEQQLAPVLF